MSRKFEFGLGVVIVLIKAIKAMYTNLTWKHLFRNKNNMAISCASNLTF